jgi:hypothetical protein
MTDGRGGRRLTSFRPKLLFASVQSDAGYLFSLDGRTAEGVIEPGHLSARELVNLRSVARRIPFDVVRLRNSRATHAFATLHGPDEIEQHLTALIHHRLNADPRFMQWLLGPSEARTLAPDLERIRRMYSLEAPSCPVAFLAQVRAQFPQVRFAHFMTGGIGHGFMVHELSPRLRDSNTGWFASSKGRLIADFPDGAYGDWSTKSYAETMWWHREPSMHQVTIDLHMGCARRYRQDYVRLSLPFDNPRTQLPQLLTFMTDLHLAERPVATE